MVTVILDTLQDDRRKWRNYHAMQRTKCYMQHWTVRDPSQWFKVPGLVLREEMGNAT